MVGLGRLADESNATRGARDQGGRGSANPPKCEKGAFGAEMSELPDQEAARGLATRLLRREAAPVIISRLTKIA